MIGLVILLRSLWHETPDPDLRYWDSTILSIINQVSSPLIVQLFSTITILGNVYFIATLFAVLAISLAISGRKRAAIIVTLSFLFSFVFILVFKYHFARPRPFGCPFVNDCYSFPSGHATMSFYAYGLLNYLAFRFLPLSFRHYWLLTFITIILVILICLSRLFLGVHYPSDLIGGFFLGSTWLLFAVLLIDLLY